MPEKNILVKGQSLSEIALLIIVVSLAILTMQVYVQWGLQGKTRDLTDEIINPENLAQRAYSAEDSRSLQPGRTISSGTIKASTGAGGISTKKINEAMQETSNTWSRGKP